MAKKQSNTVKAVKLDRSKDFYTVHGVSGAKYEQDGKLFDANDNQVDLDGNPVGGVVEAVEPEPEVEVTGGDNPEAAPAAVVSEDELAELSKGK